jgi:tetratricopeptide (TPR) repeat protein
MKLKRFNDGYDEYWDTTIIVPRKKKWWKLILMFILIFMICILIITVRYHNSNNYIFKKYYTIENIIPITRGQDDNLDAIIKFMNKDFESASNKFKKIFDKDSTNIAILFYYGVSNIEIKNYNESIRSFKYIINNKNNFYVEYAEWYLAFCYLKSGKKDKSIEMFKKISSDKDNYYSKDAQKILKKLK